MQAFRIVEQHLELLLATWEKVHGTTPRDR